MTTFYSVKLRRKVNIPDNQCTKCKAKSANGTTVYLVKAEKEGSKLVKIVSAEAYANLNVPECTGKCCKKK